MPRPTQPPEPSRRSFGATVGSTGAIAPASPALQATPTLCRVNKRGGLARRNKGEPDYPALLSQVKTLPAERPADA